MTYRDTAVALATLALGALAMAGVAGSSAYTEAAGAEARGVHALSNVLAESVGLGKAPATLMAAAPEVSR